MNENKTSPKRLEDLLTVSVMKKIMQLSPHTPANAECEITEDVIKALCNGLREIPGGEAQCF